MKLDWMSTLKLAYMIAELPTTEDIQESPEITKLLEVTRVEYTREDGMLAIPNLWVVGLDEPYAMQFTPTELLQHIGLGMRFGCV